MSENLITKDIFGTLYKGLCISGSDKHIVWIDRSNDALQKEIGILEVHVVSIGGKSLKKIASYNKCKDDEYKDIFTPLYVSICKELDIRPCVE